jgi:hypothetical protein
MIKEGWKKDRVHLSTWIEEFLNASPVRQKVDSTTVAWVS